MVNVEDGGSGQKPGFGVGGSANNSALNSVIIQNDASAVPSAVKLNGSNYPLWSKVLEMHIAGRGKKGFVTGSIKEPREDSTEFETWETGNAIVKGWLINSMEPAIMNLKTLREEVQLDRVYAFLAGLDDVFDKVRSNILRTQPLPSVEEVFSMVRREAQRHATMMGGSHIGNQGGGLAAAMVSRSPASLPSGGVSTLSVNSRSFTRENKDNLKCTFCGQIRHTEDTCFEKHGVPEWFSELKKRLRVKERGNNSSRGGRAALATATPSNNKKAEVLSGEPSQSLLTHTTLGEPSSNPGTTKEIIGRGTKREGLYYVDDVVLGRAATVRTSTTNVNGKSETDVSISAAPQQVVVESSAAPQQAAAEETEENNQGEPASAEPSIAQEQLDVTDPSTEFSSILSPLSNSIVPSHASSLNIPKFDVKNVFLHGNLEEEVYMVFPPGYDVGRKTVVCRLRKSLYGLKQSPYAWFDRFTQVMKKNGYCQCHSDHMLFVRRKLNKRKYVLDLLKEIGMLGCKPVDTPIVEKHHLGIYPDQVPVDKGRYQRLVGRLIYLAHTRPDIAYVVSVVSQFMHSPSADHMAAVMHILAYLKIEGFTDADWAGDVTDRRSTSGYFTFVGGNLVTLRSKKQKVVSRSSAEAEYRDNPVQHDRTKHVEVDRHFIKEKLERKIVSLPCVTSEEQLADVLTHAVCSRTFNDSLVKLGMCDIYAPT
ncbi:polyprotein (retrotrasposon protein) [Pyrus ussuriensis x Pyrus communis]|uniref:Polyprotein (Retrotrasposon protein) n=1 Tax=Pyrus ussuriensis x Pyrus communis TaxID=2448454 RepID=A0A5N5IB26_9ROSA|nr:polyprotein (retrotrasposon protein) [Pyrus ussuriensis x Pyrus communis]